MLGTEWKKTAAPPVWEVAEAPHISPAANRLLAEGWEPFAVYVNRFGDATLVLRHRWVVNQ